MRPVALLLAVLALGADPKAPPQPPGTETVGQMRERFYADGDHFNSAESNRYKPRWLRVWGRVQFVPRGFPPRDWHFILADPSVPVIRTGGEPSELQVPVHNYPGPLPKVGDYVTLEGRVLRGGFRFRCELWELTGPPAPGQN